MTREEAKHIVDVAFDVPQAVRRTGEDRTYHEDEIREAKNMAIKALEQEPCEDAISRQAVWDVMQELWGTSGELLDRLMALPPVTPKPMTGHWIKSKDGYMRCDQCGSRGSAIKARFCHHCGCRMVDPQESEEV